MPALGPGRRAAHRGIPVLTEDELGLRGPAPLWYYILKESEVRAGGRHLGETGGRIVAEVFLGLLEKDPSSYLRNDPAFRPFLGAADGSFGDPGPHYRGGPRSRRDYPRHRAASGSAGLSPPGLNPPGLSPPGLRRAGGRGPPPPATRTAGVVGAHRSDRTGSAPGSRSPRATPGRGPDPYGQSAVSAIRHAAAAGRRCRHPGSATYLPSRHRPGALPQDWTRRSVQRGHSDDQGRRDPRDRPGQQRLGLAPAVAAPAAPTTTTARTLTPDTAFYVDLQQSGR